MNKKYFGLLVILNLILFLILYKICDYKFDLEKNKLNQVYNNKIESMKNDFEDVNTRNEIVIDKHVHKLNNWKKINEAFNKEFSSVFYYEFYVKNFKDKNNVQSYNSVDEIKKAYLNKNMVEDDYFRYEYTAYKLLGDANYSYIDDHLCFNCHNTSLDSFKEKYKVLFGEELDMNILNKYAYKIENNIVHNAYHIGGAGSIYTVKFNHEKNLKKGKIYVFDLMDVKYLIDNFDNEYLQSLYYDIVSPTIPYFDTIRECNLKIEIEYDNENHLKTLILKEYKGAD